VAAEKEAQHMASRTRTNIAAFALAAGASLLALPAMADAAGEMIPGNPVEHCRVAEMVGGGENTQIVYTRDCSPMHSLNVERKGHLQAPRAYGTTRTPVYGGGRVIGWDGGREGGPVYESRTATGRGGTPSVLGALAR
jgi:hypothetical protein